jgi:6-phosphogluconolactonase
MTSPQAQVQVQVHPDAKLLARAAAAQLAGRIAAAVAARGAASLVLTGGGIGTQILAELAVDQVADAIDWSRCDIWWGDERFLPEGDPGRNETGARAALLDHVGVDPGRVHPMPASDGPDGDDPEAAAARYAAELRAAAPPGHGALPVFDVLLLGIGPEGHVASLFPEMAAVHETQRTVVAVRGCPKPPPTRLSLTFPAIESAREVWVLASGAEKADAVALALSGSDPAWVPAIGARGRQQTLFLLDEAAAAELPAELDPDS